MKGHGAKFGRKKEDAIVALLTHRSIEEAAAAVGVSVKSLLRWMSYRSLTLLIPKQGVPR